MRPSRPERRESLARTEIIWVDVPIMVKCLRRRCHAPRDYVAIRPCPVRVPSACLEEAPLALSPPQAGGRHATHLREIRDVDGKWFEPMLVERSRAPATPSTLSAAVANAVGNSEWGDWPFEVKREVLERRKVEAVRDADLAVTEWHCDYDALAGVESARLSTKLAVVGGVLYREVGTPEVVVRIETDQYPFATARRPNCVRIAPANLREGALASPELSRGTLSVQRWSPANADAAERFAVAYSGITGARVARQETWRPGPALDLLARDEEAAHDADLALTVRSSHRDVVGHLASGIVRAWLDLRDAADAGRFEDLPGGMADLHAALGRDGGTHARAMRARLFPDLLRFALERPRAGIGVGGYGASTPGDLDGFTP